ncbi:MAG: type VI secretion system protein TssA [Gammaproteobacteria bacterium]|nr:type VI secretion system protein TssA [Gammaproteobacteria bacterium]
MIDANLVERCITPISAAYPVGIDLRTDTAMHSRYYQIKDRRNAARDLERRQAQGENTDERADWNTIAQLCAETLTDTAKDLEVASWLVESLVRLEGVSGFVTGFTILSGLLERYWETIYPLADEEGNEIRLASLFSLNGLEYEGTLVRPIYHIPITQGSSIGPFALWQYQQALENSKLTNAAVIERRQAQGSIFINAIQIAINESATEFYQQLQHDLQTAKQIFTRYNTILAEKCGQEASPQARISAALDDFSDHLRFILKDSIHQNQLTEPLSPSTHAKQDHNLASATLAVIPGSNSIGLATWSGELTNREQALQLLGVVANYFRQTEPQSALPYVLERAQQLGRLSFPELLKELVNDDGARAAAYKLMGVTMANGT